LAVHAVAVLVGEAGFRIPAARVPVLEATDELDVLGPLARRRHQPHGYHGVGLIGDHVEVAAVVVAYEVRSTLAVLLFDVLAVGVRVLGDVRVGRDDPLRHDDPYTAAPPGVVNRVARAGPRRRHDGEFRPGAVDDPAHLAAARCSAPRRTSAPRRSRE